MEDVRQVLEREYDLGEIRKIDKNTGTSTNETYTIDSAKGRFFLKRLFPFKLMTERNVRYQIAIAHHLNDKGVKTIVPVANKKGDFLTKSKKRFYIVYPYVDIDKDTPADDRHMEVGAKVLADFHKATKDFKTKYRGSTKPLHTETNDITKFIRWDRWYKRESVVSKAEKTDSAFAGRIRKEALFVTGAIEKVLKELERAKFSEKTHLHYDFGPYNLFFSDGELRAVSDFDYSHKGYVESDVAKAAKFWSERKDGTIDIPKFRRFVLMYAKHNPNVIVDWGMYHMLVLYLVLRRLVYAAAYTIFGDADLEFLYDKDIKTVKFLLENEKEFEATS